MDRNQYSRNQKQSVPPRKGQPQTPPRTTNNTTRPRSSRPAGSTPRQNPQGISSQNRNARQQPGQQPQRRPQQRQQPSGRQNPRQQTTGQQRQQPPRRTRPQQNPQKPGYRSNAPQVQRRVTRAEKIRIRRRKAIIGVLCVLGALVFGVVLSVNLLFKVTGYRVENVDRTVPANTGIYTEQQLIDATGIQLGDNLYAFSLKEKSAQLLELMPYLDEAVVSRQAPGTVIIRVKPAVERFKLQYNANWLVLSEQLKVLRVETSEPENLIELEAYLADGAATAPGSFLTLEEATIMAQPAASDTAETADSSDLLQQKPNDVLAEMLTELDNYGLLEKTTVLSMMDLTQLNFLYDGRISVQLGTVNNLDYKIRFAAYIILDTGGDGLTSSDRGTLDISYQQADGSIQPRFLPAENPVVTPEPEPAPEEETTTEDTGDTTDETTDASADDAQNQE